MNKWISYGINPSRFLGLSYSKCMYPLRRDGRPMIIVQLVFVTVWIKLPYKHTSDYGHGSAIESWGICLSVKRKYAVLQYKFKTMRLW